MKVIKKFR